MSKVFLTGATGYVGGQVLHSITAALPDISVRFLVRDNAKEKTVKATFPRVQTVEGSLDDKETIIQEARDADIVLNFADAKHIGSVEAIHEGLKGRSTDSEPAHWIQMSAATALAAAEIADKSRTPGSPSDVRFDDLDGIADIRATIKSHPFRAVDNYILNVVADTERARTALLLGPVIYGQGQGPCNQRSVQIPALARAALQRNCAVQVGKGQSQWGNVHVADVGQLVVHLVRAAVEGRPTNRDDLWDENGIYIPSVGEMVR